MGWLLLFALCIIFYKTVQACEYRRKQRQSLAVLNVDLLDFAKAQNNRCVGGLLAQNYREQKSLLQWRLLRSLMKRESADPLFARVMLPRAEKILRDENAEVTVVYEQKAGKLFRALFPVKPRAVSLKIALFDQEYDTKTTIEDVPKELMQDFVDFDCVVRFLAHDCGIYING